MIVSSSEGNSYGAGHCWGCSFDDSPCCWFILIPCTELCWAEKYRLPCQRQKYLQSLQANYFSIPQSSKNLLSNWPDQSLPAAPLNLPMLTGGGDGVAFQLNKHFVKMVPVFSSMGPEPVTQSNTTRENKPKKTFLRNNTGSRKSYWSGLVFLAQGLIPTCCNQLRSVYRDTLVQGPCRGKELLHFCLTGLPAKG